MRRVLFAGVLAIGVALSGTARADGATASGVEIGLRTGYAIPLGNSTGGSASAALNKTFNGVVPIWIDAGYRVNPNIYVGAFFQYGIALLNSTAASGCSSSGVSCSGSDMMFGIDAHYHLMPSGPFDPYVGRGVGYEIASVSVSGGGASASASLSGIQFVNLQLGADYKAMPNLGIGPFVMFSLGQYGSCSYGGAYSSLGNCSIPQTAIHEWLPLGVRGEYDINL